MLNRLSILFVLLICHHMASSQERTMGLIQNSEDAYNGYTLFGNNETTYLIDNCGYVVNSWQSEYKTGHGMYFYPDGTLLRQGRIEGAFDAGGLGGVFELYDWDGDIIWTATIAETDLHTHHDMALLPNGNFLCTAWERISEERVKSLGRIYDGDVWSERILEIEMLPDNDYRIVWQWSMIDHTIQDINPALPNYGVIADHPERLDINYIGAKGTESGNWIHANAIDYNEDLDQIIISSRLLSEVYVIDHSISATEATGNTGGRYERGGDILYRYGNPQVYQRGSEDDRQLYGQHNVRWMPEGDAFIVFNNEHVPDTQSRVQIWRSPADESGSYHFDDKNGYGSDTLIRTYTHRSLHSDILSAAQPLPNGNILITEGRPGYFFEITPEDSIVWQYINPVNRNGGPGIQGGAPRFNMVFKGERYPVDFEGFRDKDLSPMETVESSSQPYDCEIFQEMTTAIEAGPGEKESEWILVYDALSKRVSVDSHIWSDYPITIEIYDLMGKMQKRDVIQHRDDYISIRHRDASIMIIVARSENKMIVKKLLI